MFIHSRACHAEMLEILTEHRNDLVGGGVVHSFDGSLDEMRALIDLGLYIGINGCSLRTEDSLKVAKEIPTDRLLVESDAPWCGLKPAHASSPFFQPLDFPQVKKEKAQGQEGKVMVNDRNEPVACLSVLSVLATIRNQDLNVLADHVYANSQRLFKWTPAL